MRRVGRVGGIGCLVPRSGPNLALFESCGAMDGASCAISPSTAVSTGAQIRTGSPYNYVLNKLQPF